MRKNVLPILFGFLIVALGVVYAGNILEFWDLPVSFKGWWTLFIIIPCAVSIFNGGLNVVNATGLALGSLLLLTAQGVLKNDLGYKLIAPIILIAIGLGILLQRVGKNSPEGTNGVFAGNSGENFFAIFGGNAPQFKGVVFRGANAFSIFGGIDLRLREAIIKRDCVINAYSIFGGTDIFLPDNVKCVVSSTPIFGGVANRFTSSQNEAAPTVYIRALSVFGATEIK